MVERKLSKTKQTIIVIAAIVLASLVAMSITNFSMDSGIQRDGSHVAGDFTDQTFTVDQVVSLMPSGRGGSARAEIVLIKPSASDILLKLPYLVRTERNEVVQLHSGDRIAVRVLAADLNAALNMGLLKRAVNYFTSNAERMVLVYQLANDNKTLVKRPDDQPNAVNRYSHVNFLSLLMYAAVALAVLAAGIGMLKGRRAS